MAFGPIPRTPNLVVFVTDQQRAAQHFPAPWVAANLKNLQDLTRTGLSFEQGITNACRCSPSRGVLLTGLLAPKNQLVDVGGTLSLQWPTLGQRIADHDPNIQIGYVGKWHLSAAFVDPAMTRPLPDSTLDRENELMDQGYRFPAWDAPDAGTALSYSPTKVPGAGRDEPTVEDPFVSTLNTLGGGPNSYTKNDARIAKDARAFLDGLEPDRPFVLIVSLVNPHDVWANLYAELMAEAYPEFPAAFDALPHADTFQLPLSYDEDDLSTKPTVQALTRDSYTQTWAEGHEREVPADNVLPEDAALTYLKFYAYLTHLADVQLGEVYAALKQRPDFDDTIVLRIADHGELAMSHGGSMEKDVNVYAETIEIPYIFSNPKLWPSAQTCQAPAGLVDVLPTLMGILGAPLDPGEVQGEDLSALLLRPDSGTDRPKPARDHSLFTYDDRSDWHIRAIQTAPGAIEIDGAPVLESYKYAVYYTLAHGSYGAVDRSSLQFELYIPGHDGEIDNLAPDQPEVCAAMHAKLSAAMAEVDGRGPTGGGTVTPPGWPAKPQDVAGGFQGGKQDV